MTFRLETPAAENSRRPPLRPRPACRPIALSQAAGAAFRERAMIGRDAGSRRRSDVRRHEPVHVLWGELFAQGCPKRSDAMVAQVIVEVLERWRKRQGLDADGLCPQAQLQHGPLAGRVIVL